MYMSSAVICIRKEKKNDKQYAQLIIKYEINGNIVITESYYNMSIIS